MKIIWDSLEEIKNFLLCTDITKLAAIEKNWGGLGIIIEDSTPECKAGESKVFLRADIVIITPKAKELSWLFRNLYEATLSNILDPGRLLECFWIPCVAFFIEHQEYEAKDLLLYVLSFVAGWDFETDKPFQDAADRYYDLGLPKDFVEKVQKAQQGIRSVGAKQKEDAKKNDSTESC